MTAVVDAGLSSINPFTGAPVCSARTTPPGEVGEAVSRAATAQRPWARAPVEHRAGLLSKFARLVERDRDALADLIVSEMGKRRDEADGEVEWTVRTADWYADRPPVDETCAGALVRRAPLGVVAVVTPWNVPLHTPAWKWLPALLAGNTVVWKPSELTPAVSLHATRLMEEAGFPPGVLELVLGGGESGRALVADSRVAGVHFTGSTRTGRAIARAVADRLVPCALELGGLNPVLVFEDADLDRAAGCVLQAAISINGQKCTATRQVLVADLVADRLRDALADRIRALVVGDPATSGTDLGPLVTTAAAAAARVAVTDAVSRGARVVAQSSTPHRDTFVPATLLTDVPPEDPLREHELFAPVVSLDRFAGEEEGWARANASSYGLAAAVHTRDPERIAAAPSRLDAGVVNINRRGDAVDLEAPFGGSKQSGNGHPEGGTWIYASLTRYQACYGTDARNTS